MEKIFLLSSVNGNGETYLLVLLDTETGACQKHFKTGTIEKMASHLSDEHMDGVEDRTINTNEIPCDQCSQKKKCTQKGHLTLIPPKTIQEIYQLAENLQKDGVESFLNEGE